jgi:hypothetical protein
MKLIKSTIFFVFATMVLSCSKEDTTTNSTSTSSTTTTVTWAKITAITSSGTIKPNYIVMMFDQPVTNTNALPPIIKQVTTDVNGLANFDLSTIVTSTTPKTYYFEAFVQSGSNYTMKSVSHPSSQFSKGSMYATSIIVN